MPVQVLYIENRCKLSFSNNYLIIDNANGLRRVYIEDISAVVFACLEVSVTAYLLDKLVSCGKTVIFSDGKRFPYSGIVPLYGAHNANCRIREQAAWNAVICGAVWQSVVKQKIACQRRLLEYNGLRTTFTEEVLPGDSSNVEGRFADFYFHQLFGRSFIRHLNDSVNIALNYGYTILCSAMARIVAGHGYAPAVGFHHCGANNNVNLACDCMEPFRPLIDEIVHRNGERPLDRDYKCELILALNRKIFYRGTKCEANYAMERYFCDIAAALRGESADIGEVVLC